MGCFVVAAFYAVGLLCTHNQYTNIQKPINHYTTFNAMGQYAFLKIFGNIILKSVKHDRYVIGANPPLRFKNQLFGKL